MIYLKILSDTTLSHESNHKISQQSQAQEERKSIKAGTILKLKSYQLDEDDLQVVLEQETEGINTWSLEKEKGAIIEKNDIVVPRVKQLDVPYYNQFKNLNNPTGSSSVTSLAMALAFLGANRNHLTGQFADELYEYCENHSLSRHDPSALVKVAEAYRCRDRFSTTATFLEVKDWLVAGNPVVVHGYFTPFGHVVCIVGFNEKGFIVNDSYGELIDSSWNQYYDTSKDGKELNYSYSLIYKLCCPDSQFWVHFLSKSD